MTDFRKNIQIQNFIPIRPAGAELFCAVERKDGQTHRQIDMAWLTVAFPNFTNTPKMYFYDVLQRVSWRAGVVFQVFEIIVRKYSYSFKNILLTYWKILPVWIFLFSQTNNYRENSSDISKSIKNIFRKVTLPEIPLYHVSTRISAQNS